MHFTSYVIWFVTGRSPLACTQLYVKYLLGTIAGGMNMRGVQQQLDFWSSGSQAEPNAQFVWTASSRQVPTHFSEFNMESLNAFVLMQTFQHTAQTSRDNRTWFFVMRRA